MESALLQAVADEAAARLIEQEVSSVSCLGRERYLLRFASPGRDNLLIAVPPERPRLHLLVRAGRQKEAPPDSFAALLDRELGGAILTGLEKVAGDRAIAMTFRLPGATGPASERRLIAQIFGRSANALLQDAAGNVLGSARPIRMPARAPRPVSDENPNAPVVPLVYSRRPLGEYGDDEPLAQGDPRLVSASIDPHPVDLETGRPLIVTRFDSPSEAAQVVFDLLDRVEDFQARRAHHAAQVRREINRLESLERRLTEDLERARGADRFRLWGEALLAALPAVRAAAREVTLPDPADPEGAPFTIPLDPSLSPQENAQRLFARYKKGKRGVVAIEARLQAIAAGRAAWGRLASQAEEARNAADLDALKVSMERMGLVHAPRPAKAAARPPAQETPTRVRRHMTRDGFVIMVGKSGAENDTLTFKVASPWDFWLHAAGTPGAHVIVRNPERHGVLPEGTLRVAAEMAAYYSGAKNAGKVEVHYTQRKHVHKRKGMPAGQVLLRRFRSIQVRPRLPEPALEDV
jgi:predicted ribosome quality control (RQC) complex YloA/Tae2 family protein